MADICTVAAPSSLTRAPSLQPLANATRTHLLLTPHPLPPIPLSTPLQFTFLLDDIGVPLNYRHMEGFGVHTFKLVNAAGKETLVKFHWKPKCGEFGRSRVQGGLRGGG